jgi:hypothetical protein
LPQAYQADTDPVGAAVRRSDLLAKADWQPPGMLDVLAYSRASPLPQVIYWPELRGLPKKNHRMTFFARYLPLSPLP